MQLNLKNFVEKAIKNKVVLLVGPSGSSKSFTANKIKEQSNSSCVILSTDEYFMCDVGGKKEYVFNPALLGIAHKWNFDNFCRAITDEVFTIIIDNTNLDWRSIKPYYKEALIHNYFPFLWIVESEWAENSDELFKKNLHNVPMETIIRQVEKFRCLKKQIDNGEFDRFVDKLKLEILLETMPSQDSGEVIANHAKKSWL